MLSKEKFRNEIISICKGARIRDGITQKQMSDKLDGVISEASISQFESGNNNSMYMIYAYLRTCPSLSQYWKDVPEWLKEVERCGETDEK